MKKNTVSLLEAIKKKISKIDGKEEDSAAQNLDGEFEYVEQESEADDKSASAQENQNVTEVSDINLESSIEASIGDEEKKVDTQDQVKAAEEDTEDFDLSFDDQENDKEMDFGDLDSVVDEKEDENKEEVANEESNKESSAVQEQEQEQNNQQTTTDNQQEVTEKGQAQDDTAINLDQEAAETSQEQEGEEVTTPSDQQQGSDDQQQSQDDFELGFEEISQQDPDQQNSAFLRQDEESQEPESEVGDQQTEQAPQEDVASNETAQEDSDSQSYAPDETHENKQDSSDHQDRNVEVSDQVLDDSHFEEDHDSESEFGSADFDAQDPDDDQQDDFEIDEDEEFAIDDIADDDSDTPRFAAQTLASVPSQAEENVDINDEEDEEDEEDEDINFDDLEDDLHFDEDEDGDFASDADGHGLHEDPQGQALGQVKENTHDQTASEIDFKASSQDLNSQMEEFLNSDTPPGFYENINQEQSSPQESQPPAPVEEMKPLHQHSQHQPAPDHHFVDDHNNNQYQFQTRYFAKDRDQKYKTLKQLESDITINSRIADKVSQTIQNISDTKKMIKEVDGFVGGGMLSHVAFELMKPKLEKWLEANLPDLVENVVRQEIKKIISQENE